MGMNSGIEAFEDPPPPSHHHFTPHRHSSSLTREQDRSSTTTSITQSSEYAPQNSRDWSEHPVYAAHPDSQDSPQTRQPSHMSPPLTPKTSNEAIVQQQSVPPMPESTINPMPETSSTSMPDSPTPETALFHNYLRAFYHFHPTSTVSSSGDESSITVPINQGDVILVHSVHPNGWADGTLLASGARGWLPTNYCEPFDPPEVRNLLNSLINLWDLVRSTEHDSLLVFSRQDSVRGMIAGVRLFLEKTACLSRDSDLIVGHVGLRRLRKGLLSDLSMLVKISKQLQDTVQNTEPEAVVYELLDELVLKAFKVVERAVRFHDIWSQDVEGETAAGYVSPNNRPPTPPADAASNANSPFGPENPDETDDSESKTDTTSEYDAAQISRRASKRLSTSASNRISVSHRLSYIGKGGSVAQRQNLASERLSAAHDSFLGLLGTFIGLHFNSRSSHELAATTHQSVVACRQLIAVVEEIWARDGQRQNSLQAARDVMYAKLGELAQTAKDMLTTAQNGDDVLNPDQGRQLIMTTTNCILAAGNCVSNARQTIERIGDFEFEARSVGLADQIFEALSPQPASQSPSLAGEEPIERSSSSLDKPLPLVPMPQEPIARPQPPSLTLNINSKPLPEPPTLSPAEDIQTLRPSEPAPSESPLVPAAVSPAAQTDSTASTQSPAYSALEFGMPRSESVNASVTSATDTNSTWRNSMPDGASTVSLASTRATTPDRSPMRQQNENMTGSTSELQSNASEELGVEEQVLETTFAHELIPSKDGQVLGGSLPALVERLTTHDSTPDATFVTTFYLTFRLFTTSAEFTQALIERFDYIGNSAAVGVPVRLRIYNVFKGWLETHWQPETDADILPVITDFANTKLNAVLPTAATRINDLINKVAERGDRAIFPRLVSSLGKTSTSIATFSAADSNIPTPIISKSQLNSLRLARLGGPHCSILDFDPLELARQFTIIESRIFCSIGPEELLALEWTKKADSRAVNVRAMSTLSTDLANLVADTILQLEEPKKRALIIKQWVKIAMKCLELNNYDSLMAIICSLNSSMVLRLKRTWEHVSQKTKTRLEELCTIVDVAKNYHVLRERLKNLVAPCIPFVGLYLTDLTFVHAGNPATRELTSAEPKRVINFDRYVKTAKTIGQLQRFQVPYRLAAVPELQEWMEGQIHRIRESESANVQSYYRRSLILEPRENAAKTPWYMTNNTSNAAPPVPSVNLHQNGDDHGAHHGHSRKESAGGMSTKERFDFFAALSLSRSGGSDARVGTTP